jgi:hypothetical protein
MFDGLELSHVRHRDKKGADTLIRMGSTWAKVLEGTFLLQLHGPLVGVGGSNAQLFTIDKETREKFPNAQELLAIIPDLSRPYVDYLNNKILRMISSIQINFFWKAKFYTLLDNEFHKKSTSLILRRCDYPKE